MDEKIITRYEKKNQRLFQLIYKIKLWPARSGILHGVKNIESRGNKAVVTTHCGISFVVWDSKNCRSLRWLRNSYYKKPCPKCKIPGWKIDKYSKTGFK
jgi:pyrrolysyl-tRNA synthetase-like protein